MRRQKHLGIEVYGFVVIIDGPPVLTEVGVIEATIGLGVGNLVDGLVVILDGQLVFAEVLVEEQSVRKQGF